MTYFRGHIPDPPDVVARRKGFHLLKAKRGIGAAPRPLSTNTLESAVATPVPDSTHWLTSVAIARAGATAVAARPALSVIVAVPGSTPLALARTVTFCDEETEEGA